MADGDASHADHHQDQREDEHNDTNNHDTLDSTATTARTDDPEGSKDPNGSGEKAEPVNDAGKGDADEETASTRSPHVAALASASSLVLPLTDPILALDPDVSSVDELVAMLRGQITDLAGQVTSLNSKLVKSYTQRGEIEDDLHDTQEQEALLKMRVAELERDRERWTKEIEAGGWVEKNHVQGEMQRLMATVMEETKSRETAVQAHTALETEIENLTSNLFTEANKMVAFERLARARAEEKTRTVEEAGVSMQALLEEVQVGLKDTVLKLEARDAQVADLKRRLAAHGEHVEEDENVTGEGAEDNQLGGIVFSDGERLAPLNTRNLPIRGGPATGGGSGSVSPSPMSAPRLLTSVLPYHEFLAFINYLRQTRITALSKPPEQHSSYPALGGRSFASDPAPLPQLTPDQLLAPHLLLSTHLSQAFLKRCVEEDSDPALRLDLAPGLGFLSRRSVATAIVDGSLVIEPLHSSGELPSDKCSLCGCSLERWLPNSGITRGTKPTTTAAQVAAASVNSTMRKISSSFFSRSSSSSNIAASSPVSASAPPLPARTGRNHSRTPSASEDTPFSFPTTSTAASHHPHDAFLLTHTFRTSDKSQSQRYAVCPSYCLPRLRAVCEFWTYVRVLLRGLLLEESFRFGQVGDNQPTVHGHGSTTPTPLTPARAKAANGLGITELSAEGEKAVTTAAADESIEAKDFEAEDTHTEEQGEKSEGTSAEEKAQGEAEAEKSGGESADTSDKPEEPAGGKEEAADNGEDHDTAPGTPTLGTDSASVSRSGSIKPPRPARSTARNSPKPPSNPSPPASPSLTASTEQAKSRPVLPPRRQTVTAAESHGGGGTSSSGSGWEDRCWGEVVRLKEAVFWTRVAAVAAGGEAVSTRGAKVWSPAKIAVIYYSTYGHVRTLAETIAEEVKAQGAEVTLLQIPEILSDEVRAKLHAAPRAEVPNVTSELLKEFDGYLFGFPTRYGRATAAVSAFFDATGGLWATGALVGKFAGVFTSTASQHGGQETTALTTIPFFVHHGINFVPNPYTAPELTDNSEVVGGGPYGAGAIAGGDGSRQVTVKETSIAKHQAKHFTKIVSQFVAGASVLARQAASTTTAATGAAAAPVVASGEPVLAKAIPASATESAPYSVDAPAATTAKEPTPAAAAVEPTPAPKQETTTPAPAPAAAAPAPAAAATPAPAPAPAQKKKSGLFASCCGGSAKNYD
ncbi:hypothetical protein JCM10908_000245 [Rhodotorula pacifica]|uniref:uncharacterized protein n=1 Tax=Rhodotorula pacifica TaxID=1495444 RepID=UPI00316C8CDE